MADKSTTITFTPPSTWVFTLNPVPMEKPGKVTLERAAGSTWAFESVAGLPSPEFKSTVESDRVTIDDKHSEGKKDYPYRITVKTEDGKLYTTPDKVSAGETRGRKSGMAAGPPPIIINE